MTKFAKNGQNGKISQFATKEAKLAKRTKNVDLKGLGFRGLKPKNGKILTEFAKIGFKAEKRSNLHWNCLNNLPNCQICKKES